MFVMLILLCTKMPLLAAPDGGVPEPVRYQDSGPQVILERPVIRGSMPRDRAEEAIRSRRGSVQACYRDVLKKKPGTSGRLVAKFTIGADGLVKAILFEKTGKKIPALQTCLRDEISRMRFPSTCAGITIIDQPFDFRPRPSKPKPKSSNR